MLPTQSPHEDEWFDDDGEPLNLDPWSQADREAYRDQADRMPARERRMMHTLVDDYEAVSARNRPLHRWLMTFEMLQPQPRLDLALTAASRLDFWWRRQSRRIRRIRRLFAS
jgi:hypothetical protein